MNDKSTIRYWLREPGEEDAGINLFTTNTTKVPEKGEVININSLIDKIWIESRFAHLSEKQLKALLPSEEKQVRGNYVVVDVKRWLKTSHHPYAASGSDFAFVSENSTVTSTVIPVESVKEDFEVFIEPFRHTELTETPIAKLRNALTPVFGIADLVTAMIEHPEKEKELIDLLKGSLGVTRECIDKSRELLRNDKNWK